MRGDFLMGLLIVGACLCAAIGVAFHDSGKRKKILESELPQAVVMDLPMDRPVVLRRGTEIIGLLNKDDDGDWRFLKIQEKDLLGAKASD